EFALRRLQRILVRIDLAFGDRPGAVVLVLPERPAGMNQEELRPFVAPAPGEDAGAAFHSTTWRIWKPPSSSAQRLAIASRGAPLARTTASVPWVGSLRTITSMLTPSALSGVSAASNARCAASRRSAGLKILPTPVSGIVGI